MVIARRMMKHRVNLRIVGLKVLMIICLFQASIYVMKIARNPMDALELDGVQVEQWSQAPGKVQLESNGDEAVKQDNGKKTDNDDKQNKGKKTDNEPAKADKAINQDDFNTKNDADKDKASAIRNLPQTLHTNVNILKERAIRTVCNNLGGYRVVTLLDIPTHENKGDGAIVTGELGLLAALNVTIYHHAKQRGYSEALTNKAVKESMLRATQGMDERSMMILGHGGGNLGIWTNNDHLRDVELQWFAKYKYMLLGQSLALPSAEHLAYMQHVYNRHDNITFLLRDRVSWERSRVYFQRVHSVLSPDMAFGIGPVPRFFPPSLDVIWINRQDQERAELHDPTFPEGVKYLVSDWLEVLSPRVNNVIGDSYMTTYTGFLFLQRGRVVVTDRLHGCIMATLLGIPTVVIDNRIHKLSNFLDTWPEVGEHVRVANSTQEAVRHALELLHHSPEPRPAPM